MRFHEGYDGRGVLDFDVYLRAHGQWSATITTSGDDASVARLLTAEDACTAPAFTALPSGAHAIDFSGASYAGENALSGPTGEADGGPTTADRTREGHFDVFEMGEVTGNAHGSLDAVDASDCAALQNAWSSGGYWTANASADHSAPAGGLYGTAYIVDVARGTMFGIGAGRDRRVSPAQRSTVRRVRRRPISTARRPRRVAATKPSSSRAVRCSISRTRVPSMRSSALFMSDALRGDIIHSPSVGALTDWIVTAPTKRFYSDPKRIGVGLAAAAPFETGFAQAYVGGEETQGGVVVDQWGSSFPYACEKTGATAYARDGSAVALGQFDPGGPVDGAPSGWSNPVATPCLENLVFAFAFAADQQPQSAVGSKLLDTTDGHVGRIYRPRRRGAARCGQRRRRFCARSRGLGDPRASACRGREPATCWSACRSSRSRPRLS